MPTHRHIGGSYRGADENRAQQQFGVMLAEASLEQIVREERAERIREIGLEHAQLIGWRIQPKPKHRRMPVWFAAFAISLIAYLIWQIAR